MLNSRIPVIATTNRTISRFPLSQVHQPRDHDRGEQDGEDRRHDEDQEQQREEHLPHEGQVAPGPVDRGHLSMPPMIGSSDDITAIVSAIRLFFMSSPTSWRLTNDGSWIFMRKGWSVPSEIT